MRPESGQRLAPGQARRLAWLKQGARLLDSAIGIPGTRVRIGLDPVIGLVPALGDLVSPLFAVIVLLHARQFGLPKIVQLRMVFNVALDATLGAIPGIGDVFDVFWRANDRNIALLEAHASGEGVSGLGQWLFMGLVLVLLGATLAAPFVLLGWLVNTLTG